MNVKTALKELNEAENKLIMISLLSELDKKEVYLLKKVDEVKYDGYYFKGLKGIHFEADSNWHDYKISFAGRYSDVYVLKKTIYRSRN